MLQNKKGCESCDRSLIKGPSVAIIRCNHLLAKDAEEEQPLQQERYHAPSLPGREVKDAMHPKSESRHDPAPVKTP
jgi:hypothetical protein